ncbi:MAG: DUF7521 family protein [Halovenus sp.]
MDPTLETYVILTNTVTLVCGGTVTLLAFRAYRRTGSLALGALSAGLGFVTLGALVAGGLHQVADLGFAFSVSIQSTFMAIGFAIIAFSLYAGGETQPPNLRYKISD